MKNKLVYFLFVFALFTLTPIDQLKAQKAESQSMTKLEHFQMESLLEQLDSTGRSYLPFLRRSALSCGIYQLKAGAEDKQSPHQLDEVYYVLSGVAQFTVEEKVVSIKEGDVLFVKANAVHKFHNIEKDLTLLVFFSTGETEKE